MNWYKQLKSNNILIIYLSKFISGFLFFIPIRALYLEQYLFTAKNVAIIFAVEAIGIAIFEIPTGAIADIFGRKKTIIYANLVRIIALIFLYIGGSMSMFVCYALINAFSKSLSSGTDSALIYDTLKSNKKEYLYKKVIGKYYALWPIGASIGSIIGGYMAKVSLSFPVLLTFIPLIISLVLTTFLIEPKYKKPKKKNLLIHINSSLKIIKTNKQLLILMLGGFILMAFGQSIHLLNPIFFKFKEIPIEHFGIISAFIFGLSSVGHYLSDNVSKIFGNKKTILLTVTLSPFFILLSTFHNKYYSIILLIIPSLLFGFRNPIISHLLNLEIPSNKRATIISTSHFISQIGLAIFSPILGFYTELYSINFAYQLSALCLLSVAFLFMFITDKK